MHVVAGWLVLGMALACSDSRPPRADGAVVKVDTLQGVWAAISVEEGGEARPAEVWRGTRFTFKGDKLFIRGGANAKKGEFACSFKLDRTRSPRYLDIITPEAGGMTLLCIYEVKGDELKVCCRLAQAEGGRPKKFETVRGSEAVLVVFKRQKR
jgi:uncharacterized protein (TIGR03067 family)